MSNPFRFDVSSGYSCDLLVYLLPSCGARARTRPSSPHLCPFLCIYAGFARSFLPIVHSFRVSSFRPLPLPCCTDSFSQSTSLSSFPCSSFFLPPRQCTSEERWPRLYGSSTRFGLCSSSRRVGPCSSLRLLLACFFFFLLLLLLLNFLFPRLPLFSRGLVFNAAPPGINQRSTRGDRSRSGPSAENLDKLRGEINWLASKTSLPFPPNRRRIVSPSSWESLNRSSLRSSPLFSRSPLRWLGREVVPTGNAGYK